MRIETCYFCSSKVYPGHGIRFIRNDNKVFNFCHSKCNKAFKARKNPRRAPWTKAYRKTFNKELAVDPLFEFERKRNIPMKYDRQFWLQSIEAIKRIDHLRTKREHTFVMQRLRKAREVETTRDIREVHRNLSMIRSPAAGLRERELAEQAVAEEMHDSDVEMDENPKMIEVEE